MISFYFIKVSKSTEDWFKTNILSVLVPPANKHAKLLHAALQSALKKNGYNKLPKKFIGRQLYFTIIIEQLFEN